MSGRRSHARFTVSPSVEGVVRVLRDVMVQRGPDGELVAISREPGVLEERMALELAERDRHLSFPVEVAESRPIIVDGAVRHRLRLRRV